MSARKGTKLSNWGFGRNQNTSKPEYFVPLSNSSAGLCDFFVIVTTTVTKGV